MMMPFRMLSLSLMVAFCSSCECFALRSSIISAMMNQNLARCLERGGGDYLATACVLGIAVADDEAPTGGPVDLERELHAVVLIVSAATDFCSLRNASALWRGCRCRLLARLPSSGCWCSSFL